MVQFDYLMANLICLKIYLVFGMHLKESKTTEDDTDITATWTTHLSAACHFREL